MTRIGKIARLPCDIRDQLNRRLQNGEPGRSLVAWLNSLPEVRRVLLEGFEGRPINEPNLSAWKCGGYLDWMLKQEVLGQVLKAPCRLRRSSAAPGHGLSDSLSAIIATRYAGIMADWNGQAAETFRRDLHVLNQLCRSVTLLRREDHAGMRLKLARKRLSWKRQIASKNPKIKEIKPN